MDEKEYGNELENLIIESFKQSDIFIKDGDKNVPILTREDLNQDFTNQFIKVLEDRGIITEFHNNLFDTNLDLGDCVEEKTIIDKYFNLLTSDNKTDILNCALKELIIQNTEIEERIKKQRGKTNE